MFNKYLKYKNKYLSLKKGGADKSTLETELNTNCMQLLKSIYPESEEKMTFTEYVKDPFFFSDIDILDWYKSKNPTWKPLYKINLQIPEFKYFVAGMLKDFYLSLTLKIYPDNSNINQAILDTIPQYLKIFEKIISSNYLYNDVMEIMQIYIKFYQKETIDNRCNISYINELSVFFIFPSFHKLPYWKSLTLYGAPFINFLISNNNEKVCHEISQNIRYYYTNYINILYYSYFRKTINYYTSTVEEIDANIIKLIDRMAKSNIIYMNYFKKINNLLKILRPFIIYNEFTTNDKNPDFNKSLMAFYFFYFFNIFDNIYQLGYDASCDYLNRLLYTASYNNYLFAYEPTTIIENLGKKYDVKDLNQGITLILNEKYRDGADILNKYYGSLDLPNINLLNENVYNIYDIDTYIFNYEFKKLVLDKYYDKKITELPSKVLINNNLSGRMKKIPIYSNTMDYSEDYKNDNKNLIVNFMNLIVKNLDEIVKKIEQRIFFS